jgi:hypothetical protein
MGTQEPAETKIGEQLLGVSEEPEKKRRHGPRFAANPKMLSEEGEQMMQTPEPQEFKPGDKLSLLVREPYDYDDARADRYENYQAIQYVGEVEQAQYGGPTTRLKVRWHLPAALGYNTVKGTVSTLVHIGDSVWLEARRRPKNVTAQIRGIDDKEYKMLFDQAAK